MCAMDKFAKYIVRYGRFPHHQINDISYALSVMIWDLVTFLSSTIIARALAGEGLGFIMLFAFMFALLRVYAGGFHANSHSGCICTSITIFTGSMLILKYSLNYVIYQIITVIYLCACIFIWKLSPIEQTAKRLSLSQRTKAKNILQHFMIMIILLVPCIDWMIVKTAICIKLSVISVCILQAIPIITKNTNFTKSIYRKSMYPVLHFIGLFCLVVCEKAIPMPSQIWSYQQDCPPDIARKYMK